MRKTGKYFYFFQRDYLCVSFLFANENLSNKKQMIANFFQILHLQRHHQDTTTYFTNLYSITLCKKVYFLLQQDISFPKQTISIKFFRQSLIQQFISVESKLQKSFFSRKFAFYKEKLVFSQTNFMISVISDNKHGSKPGFLGHALNS